jgi:carbon-monoxide dehydrogenase medium subunit
VKPAPFEYARPERLADALDLLAQHEHAVPLAGGQSLVPLMNARAARPGLVVDLNELGELAQLDCRDDELVLGALVRQRLVERSPAVRGLCPVLCEALPFVGTPQTRNRGTVAGSICHADPQAELPAVMVAVDATFTLRRAGGERRVAARDFFLAPMTTARRRDELLTEIRIPRQGARSAFLELASPVRAPATVAVALSMDLVGNVSVAIAGIGPVPRLVTDEGELLLADAHQRAVATALLRRGRERLALREPGAG